MVTFHERVADYPIDPMFLGRWSPRAFTTETISRDELLTMLEAARWAPSSYNSQPWRFVFGRRGTEQFDSLLSLLVDANQVWAKDAAALVVIVSNSSMRPPGKDQDVPSYTHSFDAGAASGFIALQANKMGWYVHGMIGFDLKRAALVMRVPEGYRVEAAFAVGRLGDKTQLPAQLKAMEQPSGRIHVSELAFDGTFPDA